MREIIERLIAIEKEERLRLMADNLSNYNAGEKVHLKQLAFHKCQKKNRWVFGGNRSGKTECGAVETVYMARGIHPYRQNRNNVFGWVVSLSQQVQRDVAQRKVLHYLDKRYIEEVIMLSGKKDSPEYGVIDQIKVKNSLVEFRLSVLSLVTRGEKNFKAVRLISFGLTKNRQKIFMTSVVCAF